MLTIAANDREAGGDPGHELLGSPEGEPRLPRVPVVLGLQFQYRSFSYGQSSDESGWKSTVFWNQRTSWSVRVALSPGVDHIDLAAFGLPPLSRMSTKRFSRSTV
jgi:hypothetical protein